MAVCMRVNQGPFWHADPSI